jgi:hypothetical protein
MRNHIAIAILVFLPAFATAQDKQQAIPSKAEFTDLFTRADENLKAFDSALGNARPALDKQDPDLFKKYSKAAVTAKEVLKALQETSPSAYGLVGLITTLDDVTLNASRAATVILLSHSKENNDATIAGLGAAQNGCYEVSERLTNATLRLIKVEEKVLMERVQTDSR